MDEQLEQQGDQRDKILGQLEELNMKLEKQLTFKQIFFTGIIYGIGFFVGSAILATIALGILGPFIGKIAWVGDNYERGTVILKSSQVQ